MTEVLVRAAEVRDAEALADIFSCPGVIAGTLMLPFVSVEERRERLAQPSPGLHRLVAEVDGRVVGSLTLRVEQALRRRHAGSIGMAVHDAYQNQGVGRALLQAVLDLADNWLGLQRIELTVYVDNAAAIHLYEQFGFVQEGIARKFALRHGSYVDAYQTARIDPKCVR